MNKIAFLKNILKWFLDNIKKHKIISVFILIIVLIGGYYLYKNISNNDGETRYMVAAAERGTLVTFVTGTGQVSALNQVDIKPKASGDVTYVGIKAGQTVRAGALMVQIDSTDAQKAVHDAEVKLSSAKLNLEKMKGLTTSAGILRGTKEKAQDDLDKAYDDGFNTVSDVFLNLPDIMSGLNTIVFDDGMGSINQWNIDAIEDAVKKYDDSVSVYRDETFNDYQSARELYDANLSVYKNTSRSSDQATIEDLINKTYETTREISESIKSSTNLLQFYKDKMKENGMNPKSISDTYLTSLASYTSKTNSYLLELLSAKNTIQSDRETLINADFDIADQENVVKEAEYDLLEAKRALSEYSIYAPFTGTVASTDVKKYDSISQSTAVATLITQQKVAEISLNEIDITAVRVGQKATITFDAIEDLAMTGVVSEVDSVGSVSQGVVSYSVKIVFDADDSKIKPGMTVSVSIITDAKQDVLLVQNSAIKTQGEQKYVEIFKDVSSSTLSNQNFISGILPTKVIVETGLSNDTQTEITNGLDDGDVVVTRTVSATSTTSSVTTTGMSQNKSNSSGMGIRVFSDTGGPQGR